MSDIKAVLNSDSTLKAILTLNGGSSYKSVLNTSSTLKGILNNGVTIQNRINGGTYIHFEVTQAGNNQIFVSEDLLQYTIPTFINLMKNGVNIEIGRAHV